MSAEVYELAIRARGDERFDPDPAMLADRLGRIPGVEIEGPGRFAFGERDEHGRMEVRAPGDGPVAVTIPRPWVMEKGPRVFALVFMMAEWTGGEVFDPQIDDTLRKDVVLQGLVAVRQARRQHEVEAPSPEVAPPTQPREEPPAHGERKRPWWKPGS